jgi:hypothetical protein
MRGNNVYLEAPGRTQELLNIKWTLQSAGFRIGSTWHEGQASTLALSSKDQFNTAEDYRKQILQQMYSQSVLTAERLAA